MAIMSVFLLALLAICWTTAYVSAQDFEILNITVESPIDEISRPFTGASFEAGNSLEYAMHAKASDPFDEPVCATLLDQLRYIYRLSNNSLGTAAQNSWQDQRNLLITPL
jgi:hypothetical protein